MTAVEPLADATPEIPEIRFPGGLPGFPELERFALVRWGSGESPFSLLRSLDDPDMAFVVVPPTIFFPEYEPVLTDDAASELGLETADDALLLAIVTVGDPVEESTANLLGPLVVNIRELVGAQAVLDPDRYSSTTKFN